VHRIQLRSKRYSTTGGLNNSYSYDTSGEQIGRTLAGTAYALEYDYDGQLTSITQGSSTTSFAYDAEGRRVGRTAGSTTTAYQYAGDSVLLEKQGSSTTMTYSYGNALLRKDGEYPLCDGLGSARAETSSSQVPLHNCSYNKSTSTLVFVAGYCEDLLAGCVRG